MERGKDRYFGDGLEVTTITYLEMHKHKGREVGKPLPSKTGEGGVVHMYWRQVLGVKNEGRGDAKPLISRYPSYSYSNKWSETKATRF